MLQHLELMLSHYGEDIGLRRSRFHLLYYIKGLPGSGRFRKQLTEIQNTEALRNRLQEYFMGLQGYDLSGSSRPNDGSGK